MFKGFLTLDHGQKRFNRRVSVERFELLDGYTHHAKTILLIV